MKGILLLIATLFSLSGVLAQESNIQKEVNFFRNALKIKSSQRATLSKIIIRKYDHLEEIASLRNSNENRFREKRRQIYKGTEASIKMMLDEDQLQHWQTYKINARKKNAETITALKSGNVNKQDLLDAQFGIVN